MTPVVCGIFHRKNRKTEKIEVLLFQRNLKDVGGGLFEFPGGKVEQGESETQALMRELQEEIAIRIKVNERLGSAEFEGSSGRRFKLTAYFVQGPTAEIQLLEHEQLFCQA